MKNLLMKIQRLTGIKLVWLVGIWMGMMVTSQPLLSQRIAAGAGLSLFVCSDSTVMTWGFNWESILGVPNDSVAEVPIVVGQLDRIIAIANGHTHSLALRADGTVWAWGSNKAGQLGLNDTLTRATPTQVPSLTDIVAISASMGGDGVGSHSMALKSDSTVWVWGLNEAGQLGLNDTLNRWVPQQVSGLDSIVKIAAGGYHSLAIQNNGQVWAWGANVHGQVGDGNGPTIRAVPVLLTGVDSIVEIAAGIWHSLAVQSNGQAWAWGQNNGGQLGVGDSTNRMTPVQMINGNGIRALATGGWHTLALRTNGTVWATGDNYFGELGLGDNVGRSVLTPLGGNLLATSISAGYQHSMALSVDGSGWAWGSNFVGQVGNGTLIDQWTPTPVLGLCPTYFAVSDPTYDSYFQPTTSEQNRWIAGELASSIALPDGRTMWIFGKSHLDSIAPNNTIPCARQEIANCVLLQDSVNPGDFTTYLDMVPGHPSRAYFQLPAPDTNRFYPGHGYVQNADTATIFLSQYADDSTFLGNYAARVGIVTMTVLDISKCILGNDEIDFGKAVIVDSAAGQLYLYGTKKDSTGRHPYLVRRDLANDSATWYYATPLGWSATLADARPVSDITVGENFSVTALQGHYYLITHNPKPDIVNCSLQRNILALRSDSLKGPFLATALLATTPDSAANLPIFGFGAYTHQSLTHCDSLMLSYNVRDLDTITTTNGCPSQCGNGVGQNADTWRPKFIHVPFPLLDTALSTTLTASFTSNNSGTVWSFANTSLLADSYIWHFGDPTSGQNDMSTLVNPTHNYTSPGTFTVTLIAFGCGSSDTVSFPITVVGLPNPINPFPTLQVYPNPSKGQIHIQATDLAKGSTTIEVFTLVGQKIFSETHVPTGGRLHTQIDLQVPAGVYLLRFSNNGKTTTRKLLIE